MDTVWNKILTAKQGDFISEIEWAPFTCLFFNANDSIVK